jgi:hypothetical protein
LNLSLLSLLSGFARAGEPEHVAGASYFNPGLAWQPLTWASGSVSYYTDQGDLSTILPGPDADALVAAAFSRWTLVSTAAVSATRGGQLSEDVSGTNVIFNDDRSVTMPADTLAGSTKPVAIIYDADGAVTDALLGVGSSTERFGNAVIGGPDGFTTDAHIAHGLVVLDGLCAQTSSQLPELQYRLVRVLGKVFGLGWSQLNLNVITGAPYPTPDEKAGFPVMHVLDPISCVPISLCYPNADQPKMDDRAAHSRLYPVTSANLAQFPGKQVFSASTVRIHGSVHFTDRSGNSAQPMQGVNVVARRIGYNDIFDEPYNRFGSDDANPAGLLRPCRTGIPERHWRAVSTVDRPCGPHVVATGRTVCSMAGAALRNCAAHRHQCQQGR